MNYSYLENFYQDEYEIKLVNGLGKVYLNKKRDLVQDTLREGVIFDKEVYDELVKYSKSGTTTLDIGSYIGHMSVGLKNGGSTNVLSFEPNKDIQNILNKNRSLNNVRGKVYQVALSDKNEKLYPENSMAAENKSNLGGMRWNKKNIGSDYVNAVTLDSLNIQGPISVVKIDVEGAERKVMEGAKNTFNKHKPVIVIEDFLGEHSNKQFAEKYNYKQVKTLKPNNYLWIHK